LKGVEGLKMLNPSGMQQGGDMDDFFGGFFGGGGFGGGGNQLRQGQAMQLQ